MQFFLPSYAERLIAAARLVLVASSLLAIWLDPHESAEYAGLISRLLSGYFLYALVVAALVWSWPTTPALLPPITHAFDLVAFSIFMYFTHGPTSPFFVYLVFALLCATLRWQWRGTLWTAVAALVVLTGLGLYAAGVLHDPEFELDSFIIRSVYFAVAATLLSYLGLYVQRQRSEMTELAEWPHVVPQEQGTLIRDALERAAEVLRAPRVLLAWEEAEEPGLQLASWDSGKVHWTHVPPDTFQPLVAEPLAGTSFLCLHLSSAAPMVFRKSSSGVTRWRGAALHPELQASFAIDAALALPLRGETLHGHLLFLDKQGQSLDELVLGELVAREVAARLALFYLSRRLKETAAAEERVRLACDLHDGLLQSLTGMALQLQTVQRLLREDPLTAQERLRDIQTLVASEQRGLRLFVREMKSLWLIPPEPEGGLAARLEQLVQRIQREWGLRVELNMGEARVQLPGDLAQQIYLIVREALLNAARHAQASAVGVTLNAENEHVRILVDDNGRGFSFRGFYDDAKLTEMKLGPVALKGRIASLGGSLAINSTDAGRASTSACRSPGPEYAMAIKLVLADDHPLVLDGLEQLFSAEQDIKVVARCMDGEATLAAVHKHRPDVVVLDLRMPVKDGLEVLRQIRLEKLPTRVVILTAALDEDDVVEAIRLGAPGVVLKEMAPHFLVQCIRKVHAGEQWLEKRSVSLALEQLLRREAASREIAKVVTARELEIVRMVASGLRNKDIAERLFISEGTIKMHLHNIYGKLGVDGRLQLARYAKDKGLA